MRLQGGRLGELDTVVQSFKGEIIKEMFWRVDGMSAEGQKDKIKARSRVNKVIPGKP